MTGPEAMYADLTSGDPGRLSEAAADLRKAMHDLDDSVDLIRFGQDVPDWDSPSANTMFNARAWATRASAESAFIRVNRALLAVRKARADYRTMSADADELIGRWRDFAAQETDPVQLLLGRWRVMGWFAGLRRDYGAALAVATEFLQSDPLTDAQRDWLESGLSRSLRRDLETPGELGPMIPNTLATGEDGGWTPQGLGYDPTSGLLLQTAYAGSDTQLTLIDPDTGRVVNQVQLGPGELSPDGAPGPDHGGGVSVHDGIVYVSSSDPDDPQMYSYPLDDVRHATPGSSVPAIGTPQGVRGGAYSTISGGVMYVGTFTESASDPGELWTYERDDLTGRWVETSGPHPTPGQTQGLTVRGSEIVFSTSSGRDNPASLQSYDLPDVLGRDEGGLGDPIRRVELPNMSEGTVFTPEGLLTTYESGSSTYSDGADLDDLWATMNMTVTPFSELGLADGGVLQVVPVTLEQARVSFDQAAAGLRSAGVAIDTVALPADALGGAPEGAAFAAALTAHCDTTATWISQSRISADVTASGLVATALTYEQTDSGIAGFLDRLNPFNG